MDLHLELPRLLPKAIEWAEKQANYTLQAGSPLFGQIINVAHRVGVRAPESIRIMFVQRLPWPDDPVLAAAANETGLLGPNIVGLTLGYAVFIVAGHETMRLISHECRHVHQYESYGGINGFLPIYLEQIIVYGYQDAPMEVDARNHEIHSI